MPYGGTPDALYSAVYGELKRLARGHRRARGADLTLCTTELVHEAFLKLGADSDSPWDSRAHFFGAASRAMRQVLVDFARRRHSSKRGGAWRTVSLSQSDRELEVQIDEMLALDAALDQLDAVEPRLRQVVELRFFGAVPEELIGRMLGVSVRTVERDWVKARAFLLRAMEPAGA